MLAAVAELVGELGAGPCDAGTDRAHRTAADLGSLRIGQAQELGEDKGSTAQGIQSCKQLDEQHSIGRIRKDLVVAGHLDRSDRVPEAAADGLDAGAAGDGQ
jgi:hypothetical protein